MSQRLRDYEEKRDYIRMCLNSEALLRTNGQSHPATCIDLSSSGMQLSVPCPVALGTEVEVEIGSRHSSLSGLNVTATVVRCQPGEDDLYVLGLQTTTMA